jgi:hypothetical protein
MGLFGGRIAVAAGAALASQRQYYRIDFWLCSRMAVGS